LKVRIVSEFRKRKKDPTAIYLVLTGRPPAIREQGRIGPVESARRRF